MTEPYELPLWPCSSNIPATFISHLGITYHEMFTGAYRCFRCLNMNDPMYHSQCKHLARMRMVQGGLAYSNLFENWGLSKHPVEWSYAARNDKISNYFLHYKPDILRLLSSWVPKTLPATLSSALHNSWYEFTNHLMLWPRSKTIHNNVSYSFVRV